MLRVHVTELPAHVPGFAITDGEDAAVILNADYIGTHDLSERCDVVNALLSRVADARHDVLGSSTSAY